MGSHKKWSTHDEGSEIPFYFSSVGCPTPGKRTFDRKRDAKRALKRWTSAQNQGKMSVYLCPCGGYHCGSVVMVDRETARQVAYRKLDRLTPE